MLKWCLDVCDCDVPLADAPVAEESFLPTFVDIVANLLTTSSAATLSFVVPPLVFQFVQEALFIQF